MSARRLVCALLAATALLAAGRSLATPVYTAREGRTCDNCHLGPNGWDNPANVYLRKCTMSCGGCHVDPDGGGMRNAAGRFYGRSTLPLVANSPRPTMDWDRWIGGVLYRRDRATTFNDSLPQGPRTWAESREPRFAARERLALGDPWRGPSPLAFFQGRFGALDADPLFRVSWDVRGAALLSSGGFVFPMQLDLGAALHPVEHLSLVANVGARGRTGGVSATVDDPSTPYLREGYALLHELPAQAFVKAGRFVPPFGLRLDDHTAQNRRAFGADPALPEARVSGVEVGANPNYPYLRAAWFKRAAGRPPDAFDITDVDGGDGLALDLGYRETGWSAGGSAWIERHDLAEGGDSRSFAVYGSFNPWRYRRGLPFVYQAEYDRGDWTRASGRTTSRAAFYHEVDWLAGNGVNLLLAQDWSDPDTEVKDDHAFRVTGGVQVVPVPGITLDVRVRALFPASGSSGADVFAQIHLWN